MTAPAGSGGGIDGWCIGVVIPARDESATIAECLASVRRSFLATPGAMSLWIVVVADDCTDGTAQIARTVIGDSGEVIECTVRSAGAARRLGAEAVLAHFRHHPRNRLWLANTDADTRVPDAWLPLHLELAAEGATAVAGIVMLDVSTAGEVVSRLFRETYRLDADGSHTHVHGANLGVRADAYLDVGGWSHARLAEDHCLWSRLRRAGWRLRSSVRSVVTTSGRLQGRAPGGFADTLRAHVDAHRG